MLIKVSNETLREKSFSRSSIISVKIKYPKQILKYPKNIQCVDYIIKYQFVYRISHRSDVHGILNLKGEIEYLLLT